MAVCCRRRGVQPRKFRRVCNTPGKQLQDQGCQICLQYFGHSLRNKALVLLLAPQAIAITGGQTPSGLLGTFRASILQKAHRITEGTVDHLA